MHVSTSLPPGSVDVGISVNVTCPRSSTVILNDTRPLRPAPFGFASSKQARSFPCAPRTTFSPSARDRLPSTLNAPPPRRRGACRPTSCRRRASPASDAASTTSGAASLTVGAGGGGGGGAAAGASSGASLRVHANSRNQRHQNDQGNVFHEPDSHAKLPITMPGILRPDHKADARNDRGLPLNIREFVRFHE